MNKLIRIFSYVLMGLGALIVLGGLGTGIAMLAARGAHLMERSLPFLRMLGSGSAVMIALRAMLQGLLVSGFGMLLYLAGDVARGREFPAWARAGESTREKPLKK